MSSSRLVGLPDWIAPLVSGPLNLLQEGDICAREGVDRWKMEPCFAPLLLDELKSLSLSCYDNKRKWRELVRFIVKGPPLRSSPPYME